MKKAFQAVGLSFVFTSFITGQAIAGVGTTLFLSAHPLVGLVILAGGGLDINCSDDVKSEFANNTTKKMNQCFGVEEKKEDSPFLKNCKNVLLKPEFGYFLLPAEIGSDITFKEISLETAKQIGITAKEMDDYNNNIEEINLAFQTVEADLQEIANKRNIEREELTHEDSVEAWRKLESLFSEIPALYTCVKIAQHNLAK